jgi:hypothetical protein
MSSTVWQTGCRSWYLDDSLYPAATTRSGFTYWWRTRSPRLSDYEVAK